MKWKVQILLLILFAGALIAAEEETMEERKQRIRRKYLRQRADITYSDEMVPETTSEEDIIASESYLEPEVELEPEEKGVMIPPPVVVTPPKTVNRNWLLEVGETEDPYASVFGQPDEETETEPRDWTWREPDLTPSPYSSTLPESRFKTRDYESYSVRSPGRSDSQGSGGIFTPRNTYGTQTAPIYPEQGGQGSGMFGSQYPAGDSSYNPQYKPYQSPFGQETEEQPDSQFGLGSQTTTDRFTPYRSPFQTQQEQSPWSTGYTPYKSPFQTQQEQRQQQRGSSYNQTQQEFQRQNTYEEWKKRNQAPVNPMSDDAYIQEMMPRSSR